MSIALPSDYKPGLLDGLWIKTTGKSWWQAVYTDGRVVSEWQTLVDLNDPESGRWEERNTVGLRTLILLCPNRKAYRLTAGEDNKLFQFKLAYQSPGIGNITDLQLIGVVTNTEGDCTCFAWERQERRAVMVTDNVLDMQYHRIGALGLDNLRLKF